MRFKVGTVVNLEFDIIGKYIARIVKQQMETLKSSKLRDKDEVKSREVR